MDSRCERRTQHIDIFLGVVNKMLCPAHHQTGRYTYMYVR